MVSEVQASKAVTHDFQPNQIYPAFSQLLREATEKLVSEYKLKCDDLTEKQLAEAIQQMIACGDLTRLVVRTDAQQIIYTPFTREQELLDRIGHLESILQKHGIPIMEPADSTVKASAEI